MRHRFPLPELMLFAVALVWGCSYGVAKMALIYYPVLGFLALRFGLTFVLLLPSLRDFRSAEVQTALRIGLPLGAILLAIFLCETYGIAQTSAANAAFLTIRLKAGFRCCRPAELSNCSGHGTPIVERGW